MNTSNLTTFAVALFALGSFGCSTTVRSLSATAWIAPPAGGAPAAAAPAEGAAAPAAASGGIASHYYVTYWEGSCRAVLGCSRGETHVKHCKVAADNAVACAEDAAATKAFNPE